MKEERMMILSMLEQGKISSEEAVELLDALEIEEDSNYNQSIKNETQEQLNKDKTKKVIDDFEKTLKKQGKKMEDFGAELGNKLSGLFSGIKEKSNPINILNDYETINTSLERDISHLENPTIDFKSTNGNITVNTWDKDSISIKINCKYKNGLIDRNDGFYDFYEEENRLIFKPEFSSDIMINLDIYLPNKPYRKIKLETSNGKIKIDNLNVDKVKCHTTNASISAGDIVSKEINLFTRNGRINLKSLTSPMIEAISTNSHISIEDVDSESLKISTVNGKIIVYNTCANNLIGSSSNGSIEVKNIKGENITLITSNGKIVCKDINLESIKKLELKTSNASINTDIGETDRNGYFDLKTSLGNISLELPDLIYRVNNQVNLGTRKIVAHNMDFKEEEDHFTFIASTSNGSIRIW